jgi:hypothetical protein
MQSSIRLPGGYAPIKAIAFGGPDGDTMPVSATSPLPVALSMPAANAPLAGSSAVALVVGPFAPQPGREMWLTLSGTWQGSAQLLRSTDGGVTMLPITLGGDTTCRYTANVNEPVAVETVTGASWYLDLAPTVGTVAYRVQQ